MKKYSKPVMVMDRIEMNQAIAKCSGGRNGYIAKFLGWCSKWDGGAPVRYYKTKELALSEFNRPEEAICMCWEIFKEQPDGDPVHVAYIEDYNHNGLIEENGLDNFQSVIGDWNTITASFLS